MSLACVPSISAVASSTFLVTTSTALPIFLSFLQVTSSFAEAMFICNGCCVGRVSQLGTLTLAMAGKECRFTKI